MDELTKKVFAKIDGSCGHEFDGDSLANLASEIVGLVSSETRREVGRAILDGIMHRPEDRLTISDAISIVIKTCGVE